MGTFSGNWRGDTEGSGNGGKVRKETWDRVENRERNTFWKARTEYY
jgi:hypothetical protein